MLPKLERDALVTGEPHKFVLPRASDLPYNWVVAAYLDERLPRPTSHHP